MADTIVDFARACNGWSGTGVCGRPHQFERQLRLWTGDRLTACVTASRRSVSLYAYLNVYTLRQSKCCWATSLIVSVDPSGISTPRFSHTPYRRRTFGFFCSFDMARATYSDRQVLAPKSRRLVWQQVREHFFPRIWPLTKANTTFINIVLSFRNQRTHKAAKMFSFHKPKVYRSTTGCCICKAKSSRWAFFCPFSFFVIFLSSFFVNQNNVLFTLIRKQKKNLVFSYLLSLIVFSFVVIAKHGLFTARGLPTARSTRRTLSSASSWTRGAPVKFAMRACSWLNDGKNCQLAAIGTGDM